MTARSLDAVAQELYGIYYVETKYPFEVKTEAPEMYNSYYEVQGISAARRLRRSLIREEVLHHRARLADLFRLLKESEK